MKGLSTIAALAVGANTALAAITSRANVPSVTVKGNAFFAGNNRFYVRGVDYQPGRHLWDPETNRRSC